MELKEQSCNSHEKCTELLKYLAGLEYDRKIKLVSGQYDEIIIDAVFKVKGTTEHWQLTGVMDNHGGLTLRRI